MPERGCNGVEVWEGSGVRTQQPTAARSKHEPWPLLPMLCVVKRTQNIIPIPKTGKPELTKRAQPKHAACILLQEPHRPFILSILNRLILFFFFQFALPFLTSPNAFRASKQLRVRGALGRSNIADKNVSGEI